MRLKSGTRLYPQDGAYVRVMQNEKALYPSTNVGGGAVDTND